MSLLRSASLALLALLALLSLHSATADCGIGNIDLSPLSNADLQLVDPTGRLWVLRPCAPVSYAACVQKYTRNSACSVGMGVPAMSFGDWTTDLWHKWSFIDQTNPAAGVQLFMQGQAAPQGCNPYNAFYSNVIFPCDPSATAANLTVAFDPKTCHANYTVPTALACKQPGLIAEF